MVRVEDLDLMSWQDQRWIEDTTQSEHQAQVGMRAQAQGSDLNSSNDSEGQSLQSMDIQSQ